MTSTQLIICLVCVAVIGLVGGMSIQAEWEIFPNKSLNDFKKALNDFHGSLLWTPVVGERVQTTWFGHPPKIVTLTRVESDGARSETGVLVWGKVENEDLVIEGLDSWWVRPLNQLVSITEGSFNHREE